MDDNLPFEISQLPRLHAELERRVSILEEDMDEIKQSLSDFRVETRGSLSDVKDSLSKVVVGALNSMPQWAAESLSTSRVWTGALAGFSAALIGVIVVILH